VRVTGKNQPDGTRRDASSSVPAFVIEQRQVPFESEAISCTHAARVLRECVLARKNDSILVV
jgi:hypothetical protein